MEKLQQKIKDEHKAKRTGRAAGIKKRTQGIATANPYAAGTLADLWDSDYREAERGW